MLKYVVVLIFQLYLVQDAFSLECYTTDPSILIRDNLNITNHTHTLQDCNDYFRDMAKKAGRTVGTVPPRIVMNCFTLVVNTEDNLVVKGCVPTIIPACNHLETTVKNNVSHRNSRTFKCSVCSTNGCNKENTVAGGNENNN